MNIKTIPDWQAEIVSIESGPQRLSSQKNLKTFFTMVNKLLLIVGQELHFQYFSISKFGMRTLNLLVFLSVIFTLSIWSEESPFSPKKYTELILLTVSIIHFEWSKSFSLFPCDELEPLESVKFWNFILILLWYSEKSYFKWITLMYFHMTIFPPYLWNTKKVNVFKI